MKIVTMCQRGNYRSVRLASILREKKGYREVINCGYTTTSLELFEMLCNWADKILTVSEDVDDAIHSEYKHKIVRIFVPDVYTEYQDPNVLPDILDQLNIKGI